MITEIDNTRRATGRTTKMIDSAINYARENPSQYVVIVCADYSHQNQIARIVYELASDLAAQITFVSRSALRGQDFASDSKVFWDHYAAECEYYDACRVAYLTYVSRRDYNEDTY